MGVRQLALIGVLLLMLSQLAGAPLVSSVEEPVTLGLGPQHFTLTTVKIPASEAGGIVIGIQWIGDSRAAILFDRALAVVDIDSGEILWVAKEDGMKYSSMDVDGVIAVSLYRQSPSESIVKAYTLGGEELWSARLDGMVYDVAVGKDGLVSVVGKTGEGRIFVAAIQGGEVQWRRDAGVSRAQWGSIEWSPSGDLLIASASGVAESTLYIYSPSGDLLREIRTGYMWAWGPGGSLAVVGAAPLSNGRGWMALLEDPLGEAVWNTTRVRIGVKAWFNPTGCCIATSAGDILDAGTGEIVSRLRLEGRWEAFGWSPGGGYLGVHVKGTVGEIRLYTPEAVLAARLASPPLPVESSVYAPSWAPDGRLAAVQVLLDVPPGGGSYPEKYYVVAVLDWPMYASVALHPGSAQGYVEAVKACVGGSCVDIAVGGEAVPLYVVPGRVELGLPPVSLRDRPQTPHGPGYWIGDPLGYLRGNPPGEVLDLEPTGYATIDLGALYDEALSRVHYTMPPGIEVASVRVSWSGGSLVLEKGRDYNDSLNLVGPPGDYTVDAEFRGVLGSPPQPMPKLLSLGPGDVVEAMLEPNAAMLSVVGRMTLIIVNSEGEWRITSTNSTVAWLWPNRYQIQVILHGDAWREHNLVAPEGYKFTLEVEAKPGDRIQVDEARLIEENTVTLIARNMLDTHQVLHIYLENQSLLADTLKPGEARTYKLLAGYEYIISYYNPFNPGQQSGENRILVDKPGAIIEFNMTEQEAPQMQVIVEPTQEQGEEEAKPGEAGAPAPSPGGGETPQEGGGAEAPSPAEEGDGGAPTTVLVLILVILVGAAIALSRRK